MAGCRLTAKELVLHLLGQIRTLDAQLGSIIELNPDTLHEASAAGRGRPAVGLPPALEAVTHRWIMPPIAATRVRGTQP